VAVLTLLVVLLLCGAAFAWFVQLEREGRPLVVLVFLVWLLVVESILYYSPNLVLIGLFHPEVGGVSFRVFDLLIPAAVIARMLSGRPHRLQASALLWLPFLAWLAASAVLGVLRGNNMQYLTFESKLGIYLAVVLLASEIPARTVLESVAVRRLVIGSAIVATVLTLTELAGLEIAIPIPMLPIESLGRFGSDIASIFVGMGLAVLAVALCSERGRGGMLLAATPLIVCCFAVSQRAALVALAVSILVLMVMIPLAWRRLRTTVTEMTVVGAVGLAMMMVPVVLPAVSESRPGALPFAGPVATAFTSRAKQLSGEDRINQWKKATRVIAERPVFGHGLGVTYVYWDPGFFQFKEAFLTHNIVGDLLIRTGAIGLLLFALAALSGIGVGLRMWLREPDPRIAALALGCAAAVAGILAKGLVESIFEKYRLSIFLALLLGIAIASAPRAREARSRPRPESL
jgi:O-antigen ligase